MPEERTVLDHLLEGRDALVLEVRRLSGAIEELDAVIGQIGGGRERLGEGSVNGANGVTPAAAPAAPAEIVEPEPVEPVNPPVEVEPAPRRRAPSRARKVTPRKSTSRRSSARTTEAPKSIRVHVLEMLAAEDRDFGLAEIIDRVHGAGIQAHDDAVRSITIKLMKDGRVERVGRGQYRLANRGAARHAATDNPSAAATGNSETAPAGDVVTTGGGSEDDGQNGGPADSISDDTSPSAPTGGQPTSPFTPPLNLGQPWERH